MRPIHTVLQPTVDVSGLQRGINIRLNWAPHAKRRLQPERTVQTHYTLLFLLL